MRTFLLALADARRSIRFAGTTDLGTIETECAEQPCTTYRYPPFCTDANHNGVCDGYPYQTWTQSTSIGTLAPACDAGDDTKADPDIHPVYSATGLPAGTSINATTGAITGTPSGTGAVAAVVTCTNDLGATTQSLAGTINASGAGAAVAATGHFVDCTSGDNSHAGTSDATAWKTIGKVNYRHLVRQRLVQVRHGLHDGTVSRRLERRQRRLSRDHRHVLRIRRKRIPGHAGQLHGLCASVRLQLRNASARGDPRQLSGVVPTPER